MGQSQFQNLLVQEAWNPMMMMMMQLWGRLAGYQGVIESLILANPPSFQNPQHSNLISRLDYKHIEVARRGEKPERAERAACRKVACCHGRGF